MSRKLGGNSVKASAHPHVKTKFDEGREPFYASEKGVPRRPKRVSMKTEGSTKARGVRRHLPESVSLPPPPPPPPPYAGLSTLNP